MAADGGLGNDYLLLGEFEKSLEFYDKAIRLSPRDPVLSYWYSGKAAAHFGLFAVFASIDVPASSAQTRQQFGWQPVHPGLIADLDEGHYFKEA